MEILTHMEFIDLFKKSIELMDIKSLNKEQTTRLKEHLNNLPDFVLDEATPMCMWLSGLFESKEEIDEKTMKMVIEKINKPIVIQNRRHKPI